MYICVILKFIFNDEFVYFIVVVFFYYVLFCCVLVKKFYIVIFCIFIFGDLLLNVGNNNYFKFVLVKVNMLLNGIDFLIYNVIGCFCNGKIVLDFIGEWFIFCVLF